MTTPPEGFVGIDVSKAALDVHVRPDGTARRFDNTPDGIPALVGWFTPLGPTLVVLEATGGYERAAVAAPSLGGLRLALVNPKRVRDFARAVGRSAKTDTPDAGGLAAFADEVRPPARPLDDADAQKLRALLARRGQLIGMRTMASNRLGGVKGRAVVRSMRYLGAHAARQGDAFVRAFADRLEAAGKAPKVIRIALARKLLIIANAVLRDKTPWQSGAEKCPAAA